MIEQSVITCPSCGYQAIEHMPTDACRFFYECKGCGAKLKPNPGDCCVFCFCVSVDAKSRQNLFYIGPPS